MKNNLTDLDYFRTKDDIIFLVRGYYHPENFVLSLPVFWPDPQGDRIQESGRRYSKNVKDIVGHRVPLEDIVEIFKPREAVRRFLLEPRDSIWRAILLAFLEEDVPLDDIGIFGSYLVGLAKKEGGGLIKDIDFLIYGLENFRRLRGGGFERIRQKLGLGRISQDHIDWHTQKYGQYFDPGLTNFRETLKRKWPAFQVAPGILSTVRFIYKEKEIPPNPITSAPIRKIVIKGKVLSDEGIHFMPRVFEVSAPERLFKIVTYFWAFYCAVKEGDEVEVAGTLHQDNTLISLDDGSCGIKIVN